MMQKYTKEALIKILIEFSKKVGRSPSMNEFRNKSPSSTTFINYFGSWNNALKSAGLNTKIQGSEIKISSEEMIQKVKEYYYKNNKIPQARDFPSTYCERFGRWNKLLEKAKIPLGRKRDYSKEDLLKILRDYHKKYGRVPSSKEFNKPHNFYPAPTTYDKFFGSWNTAIKEAGFKTIRADKKIN